jgi:DNA-binding MltR family transcriptional regulator
MAAAYLDDQLDSLLRKMLVDDHSVAEALFQASGPLGAFAARIDLAFALGLLGKQARRDLHLIRRIRNDFGHVARPLSFEDQPMRDRCRALYYGALGPDASPRKRFTHVALTLVGVICGKRQMARHKVSPPDLIMSEEMKMWVLGEAEPIKNASTETPSDA